MQVFAKLAASDGLANKLWKTVGKVFAPHLSSALRLRKKQEHWKTQVDKMPPVLPFTPTSHENSATAGRYHKMFKVQEPNKLAQRQKLFIESHDRRKPYRVLCLDGGGVRGTLTVTILKRILEHDPLFFSKVDAIVGTSAGGILSLLLAAGYSPSECDKIFDFAMPHIFAHNPWRIVNPFRSKYSDRAKQEILQHYLGERKMGDLPKVCTVVAFRLDGRKSDTHSFFNKEGWRPAIFSNMPMGASEINPDTDLYAWDAAMGTSAAPTFFPVHRGYVDGGIVANNPSIIAISKAIAHLPYVNTRNTVLLSLGAGTYPRHTNIFSGSTRAGEVVIGTRGHKRLTRADWGIKQWIPFLLDLLLDGDSITTEMVMHYLLPTGMYHRLDPSLPRQVALDEVDAMPELRAFGEQLDISETLSFISKHFNDDYEGDSEAGGGVLDSTYNEAWTTAATASASKASKGQQA